MRQLVSVRGLSRQLAGGEVTSRKLVEDYAEAIERADSQYRSFAALNLEEAREVADRFDASTQPPRTTLSGIPVGVKNVFHLRTVAATSSSGLGAPAGAQESALAERLRSTGVPVLGLQTCHELAYGPTGDVSHPAPAINPRDPAVVPGGSSSGSAVAVATGLAPVSYGTDTGGSIRTPASVNGLVGLKPGRNNVPTRGLNHLSTTLDRIGPIAGDVDSAYVAWHALGETSLGEAPLLEATPHSAVRLAVLAGGFLDDLDDSVGRAFSQLLQELGESGSLPEVPCDISPAIEAQSIITGAEAWQLYGDAALDQQSGLGEEVAARIVAGGEISAEALAHAHADAASFDDKIGGLLDTYDVLITPTTPITLPKLGQREVARHGSTQHTYRLLTRCTSPLNVTSASALTVPYARDADGSPVSVQIIFQHGEESKAFSFALTIERMHQGKW